MWASPFLVVGGWVGRRAALIGCRGSGRGGEAARIGGRCRRRQHGERQRQVDAQRAGKVLHDVRRRVHSHPSSAPLPCVRCTVLRLVCSRWRNGIACSLWMRPRAAACVHRVPAAAAHARGRWWQEHIGSRRNARAQCSELSALSDALSSGDQEAAPLPQVWALGVRRMLAASAPPSRSWLLSTCAPLHTVRARSVPGASSSRGRHARTGCSRRGGAQSARGADRPAADS